MKQINKIYIIIFSVFIIMTIQYFVEFGTIEYIILGLISLGLIIYGSIVALKIYKEKKKHKKQS